MYDKKKEKLPIIVGLFLVSLLIPLILHIGPLRLSVYRTFLVLSFFPALVAFIKMNGRRIYTGDICIFLICVWSSLTYALNHGIVSTVELNGIFTVETLGAYLLGRTYVRTPEDFRKVVQIIFAMALILMPFAIIETLTGRNLILQMFGNIGEVYPDVYKERRWGFDRVQGPFEHPILFGVFIGSFAGAVYYVLGYQCSIFSRVMKAGAISIVGVTALSSGPLTSLVAQYFYIFWDRIFSKRKWRWYLFAFLIAIAYIIVDIMSSRNPFAVFVSYLAFNASTAYNRIMIFKWGFINIFENPFVGIGNNDWKREWYMVPSFDMYWLIHGVRHGILGLVLNFYLFGWALLSVAFTSIRSEKISYYRLGFTCAMFGFFLSGWTVHFWKSTYVIFMFFTGCGIWMLEYRESLEGADDVLGRPKTRNEPVYSRFGSRMKRQLDRTEI